MGQATSTRVHAGTTSERIEDLAADNGGLRTSNSMTNLNFQFSSVQPWTLISPQCPFVFNSKNEETTLPGPYKKGTVSAGVGQATSTRVHAGTPSHPKSLSMHTKHE